MNIMDGRAFLIWDGHGIRYSDDKMGATKILTWDPCPVGLP